MNTQTIYINNLPASFDTKAIEQLFDAYGTITAVNYPVDKKTKRPKGYAFVTFDNADAAQNALEKHNDELEGKPLVVELAKEKPVKTKSENKPKTKPKSKKKNEK